MENDKAQRQLTEALLILQGETLAVKMLLSTLLVLQPRLRSILQEALSAMEASLLAESDEWHAMTRSAASQTLRSMLPTADTTSTPKPEALAEAAALLARLRSRPH